MIVDIALVRRVERTAGRLCARQTDRVLARNEQSGARWCDVDEGVLVAMRGAGYVNRGVGAGLGGTPPDVLLDEVERFYAECEVPPSLEVCPWVPPGVTEELRARNYRVDGFRNVYARTLDDLPSPVTNVHIEVVDHDDVDEWVAILGADHEVGSPARQMSDEFSHAIHGTQGSMHLVARVEGTAIGCGSLTIVQGVGWLGGAATLPLQRGRGTQHALLVNRLQRAQRDGCALAAVTALPGTASARNLERVGFTLLYTQAVMTLRPG